LKTITKNNWLEVNPIIASGVFARFSTHDSVKPLTASDWVERFLTQDHVLVCAEHRDEIDGYFIGAEKIEQMIEFRVGPTVVRWEARHPNLCALVHLS
jgi:hypothetical protein